MYENLILEYEDIVEFYEKKMKISGLYADGIIVVNKNLSSVDKKCIIAEEIGHYETSYGDILNQNITVNRKQEKRARNWGYEKLIPVEKLIDAYRYGCKSKYQTAEFLEVTEDFLIKSIQHYIEKYGLYYKIDNYIIKFEPLRILEIFE